MYMFWQNGALCLHPENPHEQAALQLLAVGPLRRGQPPTTPPGPPGPNTSEAVVLGAQEELAQRLVRRAESAPRELTGQLHDE